MNDKIEAYDSVYDPIKDEYFFVLPHKGNTYELVWCKNRQHYCFLDENSPHWNRLRLKDKRAIR